MHSLQHLVISRAPACMQTERSTCRSAIVIVFERPRTATNQRSCSTHSLRGACMGIYTSIICMHVCNKYSTETPSSLCVVARARTAPAKLHVHWHRPCLSNINSTIYRHHAVLLAYTHSTQTHTYAHSSTTSPLVRALRTSISVHVCLSRVGIQNHAFACSLRAHSRRVLVSLISSAYASEGIIYTCI